MYPGHYPATGGLVCFRVVLLMEDTYHVEIHVKNLMEHLEMLVVYPIVLQGFIHPSRGLFGINLKVPPGNKALQGDYQQTMMGFITRQG